jgi:hypothetical protein
MLIRIFLALGYILHNCSTIFPNVSKWGNISKEVASIGDQKINMLFEFVFLETEREQL